MLLKAPRQWIASPLAYNMVLSLINESVPSVEKYQELLKKIKRKEEYLIINKLFLSSERVGESKDLQYLLQMNLETEETNFSKSLNSLELWVRKFGYKGPILEVPYTSEFVLANAFCFRSPWFKNDNAGSSMKIFNSFNYTSDVTYDARLLELPLCSQFKLVLIIPCERDRLDSLFSRLNSEGLSAAISSLHPIFTVNSKMMTPNIDIASTVLFKDNLKKLDSGSILQSGTISVNEEGTLARIVTYLVSLKPESINAAWKYKTLTPPFHFAIISNDTPLVTGQFYKD
ncbi:unnamed protein product [Chrysodeixis includens]|uniref:Serpin domain-containing protein n=1 Tax=Chrysodeixis includens TaxID=689277 RepID=A0A9P0BKV4_CHRIL|nr:unnamed protein product [Chrysodeixis includens]